MALSYGCEQHAARSQARAQEDTMTQTAEMIAAIDESTRHILEGYMSELRTRMIAGDDVVDVEPIQIVEQPKKVVARKSKKITRTAPNRIASSHPK